jgi:hypothetical protein
VGRSWTLLGSGAPEPGDIFSELAEFFDRRDAYAGVLTALPEKRHPSADRDVERAAMSIGDG